uniref:Reverse transcriptase/retrotransposon-derived protein RNase H-like domain-containing protein n=1 Tax=Cajanus cajan TaxID=3821 RepID=A0A151RP11_CAJCA|nr:hypothetical protein KK1_034178 [Cajanus cajan]
MVNWPTQKEVKGLRGFLGITSYYRRFVKGYGLIARSLAELLKKDGFKWTEEAESSFNQLKQAMTSLPILVVLNFSKPFIVETDASSKGVGAVLLQEGKPVSFFSLKLSPRAQQNSAYE